MISERSRRWRNKEQMKTEMEMEMEKGRKKSLMEKEVRKKERDRKKRRRKERMRMEAMKDQKGKKPKKEVTTLKITQRVKKTMSLWTCLRNSLTETKGSGLQLVLRVWIIIKVRNS
jgi:hypothetical protein